MQTLVYPRAQAPTCASSENLHPRERELAEAASLITIVMSATIAARPERVWRALVSPAEFLVWDERLLEAIDPLDDYPHCGQDIRWRCRVGSVQLIMHDRPQSIVPYHKLRSEIAMGSLHFDQTYTLAREDDLEGPDAQPKTRLGLKLIASNSAPVVGAVMDRFEIRRMSVARIDSTLRFITKWCENND